MSRHGENIRKRADGRREARFIENHVGGKAKYRYVYAHTYAEVKAKRNQLLKESIPKVNGVKSHECLETLSNLWLENIKISTKESTYTRYSRNMRKYILPYFGKHNYKKIDILSINDFTQLLLERDDKNGAILSPKTLLDILIVLKSCLKFGRQHGYVRQMLYYISLFSMCKT